MQLICLMSLHIKVFYYFVVLQFAFHLYSNLAVYSKGLNILYFTLYFIKRPIL
jgi:hypothetical protein